MIVTVTAKSVASTNDQGGGTTIRARVPMAGCSYGGTMRILITAAIISAALIGFLTWAFSGITILEGAAVAGLSLLISLALGQLREKDVKLGADDTGQRHHGGRGGGGLI